MFISEGDRGPRRILINLLESEAKNLLYALDKEPHIAAAIELRVMLRNLIFTEFTENGLSDDAEDD